MARKLIENASSLLPQAPDLQSEIIRRDRERAGRAAPLGEAEDTDAQMRKGADAQADAQVSNQASESAIKQVSQQSSNQVSDCLIERVRTALLSKTIPPPGGTKASVDMSLELSRRLKQYALDHGGLTTRQIFLALVTEFLNEEGY